MRKCYKSDLVKQAKNLSLVNVYDVYFLLQDSEVVFVGRNIQNSGGIQGHLKDKKFNRYFAQFVENEETARALEIEYIKDFSPLYNKVEAGLKESVKVEKKHSTYEVPALVRMPEKQVVEMPIEKKELPVSKNYSTIELRRYLQSIDLPVGAYKLSPRAGRNYYFFNISGKLYWASANADLYSYDNVLYQPVGNNGLLKDIIFTP